MPFRPDLFMRTLGVLAAFFFVAWIVQTIRLRRARRALQEELARERSREFRVERLGLLWYPTVIASARTKTITAVKAGLPHCPQCLLALKLGEEEWACPKCGAKHPASVADLSVIDAVAKQAAGYYRERHPDYKPEAPAKG